MQEFSGCYSGKGSVMCGKNEFVKIAKRENNKKRNYLVVNGLLGKHVPASPGRVFELFDSLADLLKDAYCGEKLLLVGFAETATAVGARAAVKLRSWYIQTTREEIPKAEYLFFTESHSHATEQKLVRGDMEEVCRKVDRIVFIEDEVTTGNTIWKIIDILRKICPSHMRYAVASLLNGMGKSDLERYRSANIDLLYLIKANHENFAEIAESYCGDGRYVPLHEKRNEEAEMYAQRASHYDNPFQGCLKMFNLCGYINSRRLTAGAAYEEACGRLWKQITERLDFSGNEKVLVIGTEEFMYPPLYVGACLERCGCTVRCHSTTRSPIEVCSNEEYPLHTRYELESFYQKGRTTYIYDLMRCDRVIIITDASDMNSRGAESLLYALSLCGNNNIQIFRWCQK